MSQLTLKYRYDRSFFDQKLTRDDFGWLSISVMTDHFCGCGGFWVQWQDVNEFAEELVTFPIAKNAPIEAQWGYNMQEGDDLILRIEIAPANRRGALVVRFVIADNHETTKRVKGSFLTDYAEVDTFRLAIAKLINHEVEEAVLVGWPDSNA